MKKLIIIFIIIAIILACVFVFAKKDTDKKKKEIMRPEECLALLMNPEQNEMLTKASALMLDQQSFAKYLINDVAPYNGSIRNLKTLINEQFFTQEEQNSMLEAFSMLKGLRMIKYEGYELPFLLFELDSENKSRIQLIYVPHGGKTNNSYSIYDEYLFAQLWNIEEVDDNWYICTKKLT